MRLLDKLAVCCLALILCLSLFSFDVKFETYGPAQEVSTHAKVYFANAHAQEYEYVETEYTVLENESDDCDAECMASHGLPVVSDSDLLNQAGELVIGVTGKTLKGMGLAFAVTKFLLFLCMSPAGIKLLPFLKAKGYQLIVALSLNIGLTFITLMQSGHKWYEALLNGVIVASVSELVYQIVKKRKKAKTA